VPSNIPTPVTIAGDVMVGAHAAFANEGGDFVGTDATARADGHTRRI
jgi:hypothetical protein